MGFKKLTNEFRERALEDYANGMKLCDVAKKYDISESSIMKWRRCGLPEVRVKYTQEFKRMVVEEKIRKNLTIETCCEIYGIKKYLLKFWLKELKEEISKEIRKEKFTRKKRRRFVHATSHSGYWK